MRLSNDLERALIPRNKYKDGKLYNGYDYDNQAWVLKGKYVKCGHSENMNCQCYGKIHEDELV